MNCDRCRSPRGWLLAQTLLFLAFVVGFVGCGPSLTSVGGTVTYNGEKVKGGTLIFAPEATGGGKAAAPPASATIKEDGTYSLNTEGRSGVIAGKCKISYSAPSGEASTDPKKEGTPSPYGGLVPKDSSVEIKAGSQKIDIELIKGDPMKK